MSDVPRKTASGAANLARALPCRGLMIALIVGSVAVGCSPYVYGPEISKLADGVDALRKTDRSSKVSLAADRKGTNFRIWTAGTASGLTTKNCNDGQRGCQIWNATPGEAEREWRDAQATVDAAAGLAAPKLKALHDYVQGLKAITDASDSADLKGAQERFNGALTGVFKQLNAGADTAKFGALTNAFAWVMRTALEYSRLQSLRDATEAGHKPVVELAELLGRDIDRLRDDRIAELKRRANFLTRQLKAQKNKKVYGEILADLDRTTSLIAALQRQDGVAMGKALIKAHTALRDALKDEGRQFESAFSAIEEFTALAQEISDAFKS